MTGKSATKEKSDLGILINEIRRGKVVLFIGSGLSVEAKLPSAWEIGAQLARESGYKGRDPGDLPKVAQYYLWYSSREGLISRLREIFAGSSPKPDVTSYDLLAELGVFSRIVTTNWDDLIEKAFDRKEKRLDVISSEQNITTQRSSPYTLMKLHGDFTASDRMVITEDDYTNTYRKVNQVGSMFSLLGSWLQTQTVLFMGYSLRDPNFKFLFDLVKSQVSASVRHYAVMRDIDDYEKGAWERENVGIIKKTAYEFFREIFIEFKEFADRDVEMEYLTNEAKQPFVEVYGPAGCGKSQLLVQAQRLYRLKEPPWRTCLVADMEGVDEFELIRRLSSDLIDWELKREELIATILEYNTDDEKDWPESRRHTEALSYGTKRLSNELQSKWFAVFFDNMDLASESVVDWLEKNLLPLLWKEHHEPQTRIRIIFAERYPRRWRTWWVKSRLFPLYLGPLNDVAVGQMLRAATSQIVKVPLDKTRSEMMVRRILWLSGGHPGATRGLIKHLASRKFDVYMEDDATCRPSDLDYFRQERQSLFDEHIYPEIEPTITGLSPVIADVLKSLSALRGFNGSVLNTILTNVHPKTAIFEGEVLAELRQARLLRQPPVAPLEALDPMIRYILAEWLEIHDLDRYEAVNDLAAKSFDVWIEQMQEGGFDSEYWRTFVVESTFHHATLVQLHSEGLDRMVKVFDAHLDNLPTLAEDTNKAISAFDQLQQLLEKDRELTYKVAQNLCDEHIHEMFDELIRNVGNRKDELQVAISRTPE